MSNNKEISKKLYELRLKGKESYLEFMGIDIGKLRALEKEINSQYERLISELQDTLKETGKIIREQHAASLERFIWFINEDVESIFKYYAKSGVYFTPCIYYPFPLSSVDRGDKTIIDPPTGCGASGSVKYGKTNNIAHLKVDSGGGQGTGTINSARVKTWFKFSFTPKETGLYCIYPLVQMNGHCLLWTWGTCGGTVEDLGRGKAIATLRVRVDQLSTPVRQIEHIVFEHDSSAGSNYESGFGYDSEVNGGANMGVFLKENHEAVIWIECDIYVEIANHGRAWIDMKSSPFFYFKVPAVYWGRSRFFIPWQNKYQRQ